MARIASVSSFASRPTGRHRTGAVAPASRVSRWVASAAILALIAIPLAMTNVSGGVSATEVVKPSDMNGWLFLPENALGGFGSFVPGPETAPAGEGSARFEVETGEGLLLAKYAHVETEEVPEEELEEEDIPARIHAIPD